jgi:SAM-dependent methyltransferase
MGKAEVPLSNQGSTMQRDILDNLSPNETTVLVKKLAKWYLGLLPVELPDFYEHRKPLQRAELEYKDEAEARGFQVFFDDFSRPLDVRGKRVLDFGSGYGGRTVCYAEQGAASVTGIEVVPEMVEEGREFAKAKGCRIEFHKVAGESLPFADESFDLICSNDVFEHVEFLDLCLQECWRVLAPGGSLFAVMPPYYHPTGGSHLHGYISKSPLPNLFFSGRILMQAAEELMRARNQKYRPPALRPNDPLWSVNGTTIRKYEALISRLKFSSLEVQYTPLVSPMRTKWEKWRMKYYAWPFRLAARIPILNEIFVDRIVFIATK